MNSPIAQHRFCSVALCLILVISADCQRRSEPLVSQTPTSPARFRTPRLRFKSHGRQILHRNSNSSSKARSTKPRVTTGYDPAYVGIDYPGGDVPLETGVCSDVVVRAFRKAGIDLQKEIHDDMARAWSVYPRKWGATRPDANIDHRRVLNLMTYFDRQGKTLPVTTDRDDYLPGDIVTWDLSTGSSTLASW